MPWAPLRCLRPQRPHLMTKVWHRSRSGAIYPSKYVCSGRSTTAPLFQRVTRWSVVFTWQFPAVPSWIHKGLAQNCQDPNPENLNPQRRNHQLYPNKGPFMSCSKAARILGLPGAKLEHGGISHNVETFVWTALKHPHRQKKTSVLQPSTIVKLNFFQQLELWWKFQWEHVEQRQELFLLVVVEIAWTSRLHCSGDHPRNTKRLVTVISADWWYTQRILCV